MKITDLLNEAPIDMTGDANDPTVYGHERANPMSLKGRIQQARNQLKELAQLADSDELVVWEKITRLSKGGMFMGLEQNLEQIRHGIEELAAKRKKGGVQSRGIDQNIGEDKQNDPMVRQIQKMLNQKFNANLDVDGYLGPLTRQSIKKFLPQAKTDSAPNPKQRTAVQTDEGSATVSNCVPKNQ